MGLTILIVDAHAIFREGLRAIIAREPDVTVTGEALDGTTAVRLTRELRPDLVIMDTTLDDMVGADTIRQILVAAENTRILAFSTAADRTSVVDTLKAGATGYIMKNCTTDELIDAIRSVAANEPYLGPKTVHLLVKEFMQSVPGDDSITYHRLTQREREILQLIADGRNTKEIAFSFDVSLKTVENQRHSIMKKLKIYSVAELTKYALRQGLTTLK